MFLFTYLTQEVGYLCGVPLLKLFLGWEAHCSSSQFSSLTEVLYCKYTKTGLYIMWTVWEVPLINESLTLLQDTHESGLIRETFKLQEE